MFCYPSRFFAVVLNFWHDVEICVISSLCVSNRLYSDFRGQITWETLALMERKGRKEWKSWEEWAKVQKKEDQKKNPKNCCRLLEFSGVRFSVHDNVASVCRRVSCDFQCKMRPRRRDQISLVCWYFLRFRVALTRNKIFVPPPMTTQYNSTLVAVSVWWVGDLRVSIIGLVVFEKRVIVVVIEE